MPTTAGALALEALDEDDRSWVLRNLGDPPEVRWAIGQLRTMRKREEADDLRDNPVVTPDGRFQVIVIDPPWKYDSRADDATHRGKNPYPDMTVEEISRVAGRREGAG